ncbi:MAG: hypothetical protein JOZ49_22440 [Mycolicibacterium sp.]|nr:hypothetical protein [Mycolicibacterium sp.]
MIDKVCDVVGRYLDPPTRRCHLSNTHADHWTWPRDLVTAGGVGVRPLADVWVCDHKFKASSALPATTRASSAAVMGIWRRQSAPAVGARQG